MKKTAKVEPLSWDPVRKGDVYCAPACGFDCKMAAYYAAVKAARFLCKDLGPGWTPHVWENMGWYYSAKSPCGRWKIHPFIYDRKLHSYNAFLGPGASGGIWAAGGKTPLAAMRNCWKKAKTQLVWYSDAMSNAQPEKVATRAKRKL